MTTTIDRGTFAEAELSALRLDGDCFALGDLIVPVDVPIDPGARAASIAPAAGRYGLVAGTWTAAWIHGAWPVLPRPHTLCVDLRGSRRTRTPSARLREVLFSRDDLQTLSGVLVTTAPRTATDLARLEEEFPATTARVVGALLDLAGLDLRTAADRLASGRPLPNRRRALDRLRGMIADGGPPHPGAVPLPVPAGRGESAAGVETYPAETRYTS